jgi:site-specific DNA recombinase
LALFGIVFSTLSAHSLLEGGAATAMVATVPDERYGVRARRRRAPQVEDSRAAMYARYSSELQDEKSIDDQLRECRAAADRNDHQIPAELLYADEAVSGTVRHRVHLDRLLQDAADGKFRVLYFYSLSRLARESLIGLSVIKELVQVHRVRVISVTEGLDSNNQGWETLAMVFFIIHEQFIRDLSRHVHKGLIGTLEDKFSVGDWRYGYTSVPSPGGETIHRGGIFIPRRVYSIVDEQARWVRQIFHWFVVEGRSLRWIARELNRQHAPRDRRAQTSKWTPAVVKGILRSPKYVGVWPWGQTKNERDPNSGSVFQVERPEEECAEWLRQFPELRLIEDDVFARAQELLDANDERCERVRDDEGHLHGSNGAGQRRQLLTGLFSCPVCEAPFYVTGASGDYMQCSNARDGACDCKTMLPRRIAAQMILEAVGQRMIDNPEWLAAAHKSCITSWEESRANNPQSSDELRTKIQALTAKIAKLVDQLEDEDDPDLRQRLRERRREKEDVQQELDRLESSERRMPSAPSLEWIIERLKALHEVLQSDAPAANDALRQLLGGSIPLELISEDGRKRKYWRGTLRINSLAFPELAVSLQAGDSSSNGILYETVVLDFRNLPREEEQIEDAWRLLQQGYSFTEIAVDLGVGKARTSFIMALVARRYGNGLTAKELKKRFEHLRPRRHAYDEYIEPAMALYHDGVLIDEIATRLGTYRKMINQAIEAWHAARGLPVPDGRTRRQSLDYKGRSAWTDRRRNTGGDSPQAT